MPAMLWRRVDTTDGDAIAGRSHGRGHRHRLALMLPKQNLIGGDGSLGGLSGCVAVAGLVDLTCEGISPSSDQIEIMRFCHPGSPRHVTRNDDLAQFVDTLCHLDGRVSSGAL